MASGAAACTRRLSSSDAEEPGPPVFRGFSSQYRTFRQPRAARPARFLAADGRETDLGQFRGKVVVLNFWATWCAPCISEMPSLDRLQAVFGGTFLAVVPVSIDKAPVSLLRRFYARHELKNLQIYRDPYSRMGYHDSENANDAQFALYGLPITYVVDAESRIRGYLIGAADWESAAAHRFVSYFMRGVSRNQVERNEASTNSWPPAKRNG